MSFSRQEKKEEENKLSLFICCLVFVDLMINICKYDYTRKMKDLFFTKIDEVCCHRSIEYDQFVLIIDDL